MKCELCGGDPDLLIPVPLRRGEKLESLACLPCAIKSGLYCLDHEKPLQGFAGGTAACLDCIEDIVGEAGENEARFIFELLKENISPESWEELDSWSQVSSALTRNSQEKCVFRAVVTASLRYKMTIDEMLERAVFEKGVAFML